MNFNKAPGSDLPVPDSQENKKPETGKKVFDFLEKTKFLELRKSDEEFNKWFQNLSYEDYSNYLTRLNGILRDKPANARSVDGKDVVVSGMMSIAYLPPCADQKDGMMQDVFEALKKIPDNNDRALLLYYSLQYIHPYNDGNGRTGRLAYELFSETGKNTTKESLAELLDHDTNDEGEKGKGRNIFSKKIDTPEIVSGCINRELAKEIFGKDFTDEYGKMSLVGQTDVMVLSESVKNTLPPVEAFSSDGIFQESGGFFSISALVLKKLMIEKPELEKYLIKANSLLDEGTFTEDDGKKKFLIDGEEIAQNMTNEEAKRLIEIHKDMKAKFMKTLIDVFENPDNHKVKTKGGDTFQLKESFTAVN